MQTGPMSVVIKMLRTKFMNGPNFKQNEGLQFRRKKSFVFFSAHLCVLDDKTIDVVSLINLSSNSLGIFDRAS